MQQLKWNFMIPAHGLASSSAASQAAQAAAAANLSAVEAAGSGQTADQQQQPAANKSPSQMSLQEILASGEWPPIAFS